MRNAFYMHDTSFWKLVGGLNFHGPVYANQISETKVFIKTVLMLITTEWRKTTFHASISFEIIQGSSEVVILQHHYKGIVVADFKERHQEFKKKKKHRNDVFQKQDLLFDTKFVVVEIVASFPLPVLIEPSNRFTRFL